MEELPPAKSQRVAKLPGGALYLEADWTVMHPVSLSLLSLAMRSLTIIVAFYFSPRPITNRPTKA